MSVWDWVARMSVVERVLWVAWAGGLLLLLIGVVTQSGLLTAAGALACLFTGVGLAEQASYRRYEGRRRPPG